MGSRVNTFVGRVYKGWWPGLGRGLNYQPPACDANTLTLHYAL